MNTTIKFYKTNEQYGAFSNFSKHSVYIDGDFWMTTEHYFQAQKFIHDKDYYNEIRNATHPGSAASLGRSRDRKIRDDWEEVKDYIMYIAVLSKFTTHADLRELLLSTGNAYLVEDSPVDYYWGIGADGSGRNKLGLTLMLVRTVLQYVNNQNQLLLSNSDTE